MTLPLVISVPHAGLRVPAEVASACTLSAAEIEADSDGGAGEIYSFADEAGAFVTTDVARAVVDVNRARDDRRLDGVVKTHTSYKVAVWDPALSEAEVEGLLAAYYDPYHAQLAELSAAGRWPLGVDCHTMAAAGPPVGPDPGRERPWVCVSNADGTCPQEWARHSAGGPPAAARRTGENQRPLPGRLHLTRLLSRDALGPDRAVPRALPAPRRQAPSRAHRSAPLGRPPRLTTKTSSCVRGRRYRLG